MMGAAFSDKGGKAALVKAIRRLDEYEAWKRAVHIRDRFACQHCGKRNGRRRIIEADHIKPFSQIIREQKITSLEQALSCAALWDVDNGRTLCHGCHQLTESYPKGFRGKR